jgi:uncharacterized protein (DUF433 family)
MSAKTIELYDRITVNPDICHGKPCIKGTRIFISIILDWLTAGASFEDILDAYPSLTREDIVAVLEYSKLLIEKQQKVAQKADIST